MTGKGLDAIPLRIPVKWDPAWFERFVRETLALADARNALEGAGVTITGQSDEPATIAASVDVSNLLAASLITVLDSTLENARRLFVESGVLELDDNGPGHTIVLSITDHGIPLSKLTSVTPYSVLGDDAGAGILGEITAAANDRILARASDVLGFVQVSNEMLVDMVEATVKGRAAGAGTGTPSDLTMTELTALVEVFTDLLSGAVPASGGGTTNYLRADGNWAAPAGGTDLLSVLTADGDLLTRASAALDRVGIGTDGQVLTVSGGLPVWADPPSGGGGGFGSVLLDAYVYDCRDDGFEPTPYELSYV